MYIYIISDAHTKKLRTISFLLFQKNKNDFFLTKYEINTEKKNAKAALTTSITFSLAVNLSVRDIW